MTGLRDFERALQEIIPDDGRAVAVFSALWPIARATRLPAEALCVEISAMLTGFLEHRTLMMPTFTSGFKNGLCNLDEEPSTTGALTEHFRGLDGVRRTRSAYFSFAVKGPGADELAALRPPDAWGDGSLYAWLYDNAAHIVTIGVHPTHCSFSHYAEWLRREIIFYRFNREFKGQVIHEGTRETMVESLFLRQNDPSPVNDFTWLLDDYIDHGMSVKDVDGVSVSCIGARTKADIITDHLDRDPLAVIKNRQDFEDRRR